MGLIFIVLYNLVGITTQKVSAAVAAVSYKMSLIIPAMFGVYLYGEQLSVWQYLGIALALGAVVLTFVPVQKIASSLPIDKTLLVVLPTILFIGSGIQDTLIKLY